MTLEDRTYNLNGAVIKEAGIRDIKIGKNCTIIAPVNLYECTIGDNCFIGPFVEIQRNARIGNNTRVSSHSFICEGVTIGDNCFIGHGVMFINDTFSALGRPAYKERQYRKETYVGDNVTIGSNAAILPVKICNHAIIGAGAVVTKNISKPGIYAGNPARYFRDVPNA